jgi:hypothetical protein
VEAEHETSCLLVLVAVVLVAASMFAALVALASGSLLCEQGCEGTLNVIRRAQEVVGVAGVVPAVAFLVFAIRGNIRWAWIALAVGVVTYIVWGVLLELLTHPRDHGIEV